LERQKKTAAAEAEQRRARQERRKKALAALHAHGFERLATSRTETWQVWEKRTFGRQRLHERSRVLDSAVLLGNLRWRVGGWDDKRDVSIHEDRFYATGLTKSGQIVLMDPNDGRGLGVEFDDHAAVGEALWNVLEQHGVREAGS
jgi:hypothetical protein